MHGRIQVCPIEPTRLLVKELKEAGKTNIDMVEWEQVHSICSDLFENIENICHNQHNRRWCTFWQRESEILIYVSQFWQFCCEFTHFLVYFYKTK